MDAVCTGGHVEGEVDGVDTVIGGGGVIFGGTIFGGVISVCADGQDEVIYKRERRK